jgi:hypothetical protein
MIQVARQSFAPILWSDFLHFMPVVVARIVDQDYQRHETVKSREFCERFHLIWFDRGAARAIDIATSWLRS